MREHEVPTHVQAEDRVLLGFTFPQVVAVMAVCAISYGAYRYAPVGPSEVRTALAVVLGLVGVAMIVGKIGGRRLPLVAADLLKYRLGARRYTGPASQLVRSEPPAPPQPANSGPGPLRLMARRAGRSLSQAAQDAQEDPQEQGAAQRAEAVVRQAQGEGRGQRPRPRSPGRDPGDQAAEAPQGPPANRGRRRPRGGGRGPAPGRPGRRPLGGRDRLRATGAGGRPPDIRRGPDRLRRPGRRDPAGRHRPGPPGAGLRRLRRAAPCASGVRQAWPGGSASTTPSPCTAPNAVADLLLGRRPRTGGGGHRQARADPAPAAGNRRASSATCAWSPWAGRPRPSPASSSPSAPPSSRSRSSSRRWPDTPASPRRRSWTPR